MFAYGSLLRDPGVDPRGLVFAVLDVETTGLEPVEGSRICEIAVVRMRGDGEVLDEYATLVQPGCHIENDWAHGITDADVAGVPTFDDVAGDLLAMLGGAVVVGHNLVFEERHLDAEFARLGVCPRGLPGLCTLLTTRIHLDRLGYGLANIALLVTEEWPVAQHTALGDARATARLLAALVDRSPQRLSWFGPAPGTLPILARSRRIAPRAAELRKGNEGWLSTLTARLPLMADPPPPRADGLERYRALLGHALADGRIVNEEAHQLAVLAARAGLTQITARQVHEDFLAAARTRAEADDIVTSAELRELQRAARELAARHLITDLEQQAAADRARRSGPLKGWRVLPVGDTVEVAAVVDLAVEHGASAAVNVTKTVRLVVAPEGSSDLRATRAREMGIPVMTSGAARAELEREIKRGRSAALFESERGAGVAAQLEAEREQGSQEGSPEWHEFWRPRQLSPAEYQHLFVDRDEDWDEGDYGERAIRVSIDPGPPARAPTAVKTRGGGCAGVTVLVMTLGGLVAVAGKLTRRMWA